MSRTKNFAIKALSSALLCALVHQANAAIDIVSPYLPELDGEFLAHLRVYNSNLTAAQQASLPVGVRNNGFGGSFTIALDNKIIYEKAFGSANATGTVLVQPHHTFRVASIHKPITALGIMKLVQDGQLSLDSKVFGPNGILNHPVYYEGIDLNNTSLVQNRARLESITVGHLLSHRSGWIGDEVNTFELPQVRQKLTSRGLSVPANFTDQIIKAAIISPIPNVPGTGTGAIQPGENRCDTRSTGWSYNNFGPQILGRIIERVSGQSLQDFFDSRIKSNWDHTLELRTSQSFFNNQHPNEAYYFHFDYPQNKQAYNSDNPNVQVPVQYGGFYVDTTWSASSRALVKILNAMDELKILNNTNLNKMLVPPTIVSSSITRSSSHTAIPVCQHFHYAHGWGRGGDLINPDGSEGSSWTVGNNWEHNGGMPGSMSYMRHDQYGYSYAGVVNVAPGVTYETTEAMMKRVMKNLRNKYPNLRAGVFEAEYQTTMTGVKHSTYVDLADYAGSYIEFQMVSPSAMTRTFQVRYATSGNKTMSVSVNGAGNQTETFSSTGSNSSFSEYKWITLTLQPGLNTVRFTAQNSSGGPNFQWIKVL
jgi:CubicO group peptidase (beta-lactamase class C family)